MLQIKEDTDAIIICEVPNFRRLIYLVMLISCFIVGFSYRRENLIFLTLIFGGISFLTLFYLARSPKTTVKLSKQNKFLTVEKQGLFKNNFKIYSFREIAELIHVEEIKNSKGNIICKFIMPLKSGNIVELFNMSSSNTGKYFNAANIMNDRIFDSDFKLSAFNDI